MECEKTPLRTIEGVYRSVDGIEVKVVQRILTYAEDCEGKELAGFRAGHWDGLKLRAWLLSNDKDSINDLSPEEVAKLYSSDCYIQGDDLNTPAGRRMFLLYVAYSLGWKKNRGMGEGWSLPLEPSPENIADTFPEAEMTGLIANITRLKDLEASEVKN